jgi:hypothetical protein
MEDPLLGVLADSTQDSQFLVDFRLDFFQVPDGFRQLGIYIVHRFASSVAAPHT